MGMPTMDNHIALSNNKGVENQTLRVEGIGYHVEGHP
jgi:hypothetical protein